MAKKPALPDLPPKDDTQAVGGTGGGAGVGKVSVPDLIIVHHTPPRP